MSLMLSEPDGTPPGDALQLRELLSFISHGWGVLQ